MAKIINRRIRSGKLSTKTGSKTKVMKMDLKDTNEETFYSAAYQLKFSENETSLLEKLGQLFLAAAAMRTEAESNPLLVGRPEVMKAVKISMRDAIDLQRVCTKARTENMGH